MIHSGCHDGSAAECMQSLQYRRIPHKWAGIAASRHISANLAILLRIIVIYHINMYRFVLLSFSKKREKNGLCVGFLPPAVRGIFCVFVYVHFLCEISLLKKKSHAGT